MSELSPLLELLKTVGPGGIVCVVLAWGWWSERAERLALTDKLWTLVQSSVAAENAMAQSLNVLSAKIK